MSYQKPTSGVYEMVKFEMERLAFVGDSSLNLCVVLDHVLSRGSIGLEKELSKEKTSLLKDDCLGNLVERSGITDVLLFNDETS
jgi:hypothetical protein